MEFQVKTEKTLTATTSNCTALELLESICGKIVRKSADKMLSKDLKLKFNRIFLQLFF